MPCGQLWAVGKVAGHRDPTAQGWPMQPDSQGQTSWHEDAYLLRVEQQKQQWG